MDIEFEFYLLFQDELDFNLLYKDAVERNLKLKEEFKRLEGSNKVILFKKSK